VLGEIPVHTDSVATVRLEYPIQDDINRGSSVSFAPRICHGFCAYEIFFARRERKSRLGKMLNDTIGKACEGEKVSAIELAKLLGK